MKRAPGLERLWDEQRSHSYLACSNVRIVQMQPTRDQMLHIHVLSDQ